MSKAQFEMVRELIEEQRYDEARRALIAMRPNPKAEQWLERLNRIAPPPEADPTLVSEAVVRREVEAALAERDKRDRNRRTLGCAFRLAIWGTIIACQLVWIMPVITVLSNMSNAPQAAWVNQRIMEFNDSFVGDAVNQVTERVVSAGASQMAPAVEQMCKTRVDDPAQQALCEDYAAESVECLGREGDITACLGEMMVEVCVEQMNGLPNGRELCEQQVADYLPQVLERQK